MHHDGWSMKLAKKVSLGVSPRIDFAPRNEGYIKTNLSQKKGKRIGEDFDTQRRYIR